MLDINCDNQDDNVGPIKESPVPINTSGDRDQHMPAPMTLETDFVSAQLNVTTLTIFYIRDNQIQRYVTGTTYKLQIGNDTFILTEQKGSICVKRDDLLNNNNTVDT